MQLCKLTEPPDQFGEHARITLYQTPISCRHAPLVQCRLLGLRRFDRRVLYRSNKRTPTRVGVPLAEVWERDQVSSPDLGAILKVQVRGGHQKCNSCTLHKRTYFHSMFNDNTSQCSCALFTKEHYVTASM